jgi:hypothetical protein
MKRFIQWAMPTKKFKCFKKSQLRTDLKSILSLKSKITCPFLRYILDLDKNFTYFYWLMGKSYT